MSIAITMIIVSIILPLMFRTKEQDTENDNKIVFEFSKIFKIVMLFCALVFILISIIFLIESINKGDKSELVAVIIFALFAILSSFLYLLARNKKIIYVDNILYVYNIFGKQKKFNVADIKEAIEVPSSGMKLIFEDNNKVKIDTELNNYSKIKDILEKNNIIYKDINGNNAPKGW